MLLNKKGFTLVELMVVIAIIAIIAAIAIPAYSNHILKTQLQDEINKMDNYRKAIAVFIQETGATSDEEFQSNIANVKDNYLGDANVAIMSELKQNNGRLLAHPVINGTTYQIALTPRINDNGSLINWECNITVEDGGSYSTPPSSAMPGNCNASSGDLNDDQQAYINTFNEELVSVRNAALTQAKDEWDDLYDQKELEDENSAEEGTLGDLNSKIEDAEDIIDQQRTLQADPLDVFRDAGLGTPNSVAGFDNAFDQKITDLTNNDNGVTQLNSELSTLEAQRDSYDGDTSDQAYQDILSDIAAKETEISNARDGQGLNQLTAYRDSLDQNDPNYTAAAQTVTNRQDEIDTLNTAKTTYDNAQDEIDSQNQTISGLNQDVIDRKGVLNDQARSESSYDSKVTSANQNFNDGLDELNASDAFGQDHVTTNTTKVALDSTSSSQELE
nr:prepilin-type N-terminal cleavage/methylation domain-containing protein [Francisella sp. FSC1006]